MLEEINDAKVSAYMNDREKADFGSGIKTRNHIPSSKY